MVLHVIKSNIYSGAENVVCQIIKGLSDREDFIYMSPRGPIEDKLKSIGLINCYRGIDKLSVSEIKKAVDELHPTVVHAHDFTASVLCGFALKGKVPVISHIHCNPLWLKNRFHPNSISFLIASRWFSQIIAVSDAVNNEYIYSSSLKCPMSTMGNPFSMKQVISAAEDSANTPHSDILYVGRFNEAKNPLGAIKIFENLPNHNSLTFRMIGNGELLQECKDYVASHGLGNSIIFEGFQDNAYKYMKNSNIILMPSIFEGFGLVALEAMSLGIPVICSGVGGLSGIVNDSCGYICSDFSSYTSAFTELLSNNDLYNKKSASAISQAKAFDNIETYCDNLYKIYKRYV